MGQALLDLAIAASLLLTAAGIGRLMLKAAGLRKAAVPAYTAFALALGLAAIAAAAGLLAWAGLLHAPLVHLLIIALLLATGPPFLRALLQSDIRKELRRLLELTLLEKVLLVLSAAQVLALALTITGPVLGGGTVAWRAQSPAYAAGGRLLMEHLTAMTVVAGSEAAAQLLHLALVVAAAYATFALARRVFSRKVAVTALAVFVLTPQLVGAVGLLAPECATALSIVLCFLAIHAWVRCERSERRPWMITLALLSAFIAAASRAGAAHVALALPAVLWVLALRFRESTASIVRAMAAFVFAVVVLGGVWHTQTGDAGALRVRSVPELVREPAAEPHSFAASIVTYPWDVTMNGGGLGMLSTDSPGPLPLAFIPLLLLVLRPVPRAALLMLAYAAAFAAAAAFTSGVPPHMVPVFGLTSIATALGIERMRKLGNLAGTAANCALVAACVLQVGISARAAAGDAAPSSAGYARAAGVSASDAFTFLRNHCPSGRIMMLYGTAPHCTESTFPLVQGQLCCSDYRSEDALARAVRLLNVDYIYVDEYSQAAAQAQQARLEPRVAELQQWLLQTCCRIVYKAGAPGDGIRIYRFLDPWPGTKNERL